MQQLETLLLTCIQADKRRYIFSTHTSSWRTCNRLLRFISVWSQQDKELLHRTDIDRLHTEIKNVHTTLLFDVKYFCDQFNTIFTYTGSLPFEFILHMDCSSKNFDIDTCDIEQFNAFKQAHIHAYHDDDLDNIGLRILTNNRIDYCDENRRLTWLDFNEELIHLLPMNDLLYHCKHKTLILEDIVANEILKRLERMHNVQDVYTFIKDYKLITPTHEFTSDFLAIILHLGQYLENESFIRVSKQFIGSIVEELEVINLLVNMFIHSLASSTFHEQHCEQFQSLNQRQLCLINQVCLCVTHIIKHHLQRTSSRVETFINELFYHEFKLFECKIEDGCSSCFEHTFHYYTINTWIHTFVYLLVQTYSESLGESSKSVDPMIVQTQIIKLIYPEQESEIISKCYQNVLNAPEIPTVTSLADALQSIDMFINKCNILLDK